MLLTLAVEDTKHCRSHVLMQGEDTHTALTVLTADSYRQTKPDPNLAETRVLIQTLVSECPPCGQGHMTKVYCRIRTITSKEANHKVDHVALKKHNSD